MAVGVATADVMSRARAGDGDGDAFRELIEPAENSTCIATGCSDLSRMPRTPSRTR